jgi:hydrogenase expression/formation protein HypC
LQRLSFEAVAVAEFRELETGDGAMCLGVPGKVVRIDENPLGMTMGRVNFAGITKDVCLAYVPGVQVGDYVVVHVGFAISKVDEDEARRTFEYLETMDELGELHIAQPDDAGALR